jgi:hypothetical protein
MSSNLRYTIYASLAGLGICCAVYLVNAALAGAGLRADETLLDDALLGFFAAISLFFLLRQLDISRELRRQKHYESVISELNHHIRNALQIIVNHTEIEIHNLAELDDIRDAVSRIDWALREILPHDYGDPGAVAPYRRASTEQSSTDTSPVDPSDRRGDSSGSPGGTSGSQG